MAKGLALTAGVLAVGLSGCFGGAAAFLCSSNEQCEAKGGGRCEPDGLCSYADPSCGESGQRYGDNAGDKSDKCVGEGGGGDGGIDTPPQAVCYGDPNGLVKPCFPSAPTDDVVLPGMIDTSTSTLCSTTVTSSDNSTNDYCVIAGATISAPNQVSVRGAKPLVLVAATTISIAANLDAASHRMPAKIGPGADHADCVLGTASGTNGGGAGGTMIGLGGDGGGDPNGNNAGLSNKTAQTVTRLRGGCPGQTADGRGGHGGGAVYLIAETSITISARINASGEGGLPGTNAGGGGGGGGSGGMIGLDAPMIMNMGNGVVFASGASGAEGGGSIGTDGRSGNEPTDAQPSGTSGGASQTGGDGGGGSGGGTGGGTTTGGGGQPGTSFQGNDGGGGGGGGGAGLIKVYRGTLGGAYAPNPTP